MTLNKERNRQKKRKHKRKNSKTAVILTGVAVVLLLGIAAGLGWSFVQKRSTPEETLAEYTRLLNEKNYKEMYALLDKETKARVKETDFIERNQKIYEGIEADHIQVKAKEEQKETDGKVQLVYDTVMNSAAGEIEFENRAAFVKENERYRLVWDSTMIFPYLEDEYKVQIDTETAVRGNIYDRNGVLLAGEGTVTEAGIVPGKLENKEEAVQKTAELLSMSVENIENKLNASYVKEDTFVPLKIISKGETEKEEALLQIPGVLLNDAEARVYPLGAAAGHLTGYVQAVTAEDLEILKEKGYHENSVVGKAGLELAFEEELRPHDGCSIQIVDEEGTKLETIAYLPEENGKDVYTTIDAKVQQTAYEQFASDPGVAAAMDPKSGQVLALVSTPGYDPNEFIAGISDVRWKELTEDKNNPMLNRFSQAWVPGSTFKAVTAAVGVDFGKLDPNANLGYEQGLRWQKDAGWGDYYVTTLTDYGEEVNLRNAMVYSDNIYFAKAALQIGGETLEQGFQKMGFGEEIEFPLYLQPSSYSNKEEGEEVFASDIQLADTGYGQGALLVNPLHLLSMYSMFVNEGNMIQPVLRAEEEAKPLYWKEQAVSKETAELVKQTLIPVIEDPAGTGASARIEGVHLLGKTGTAEMKEKQDSAEGIERGWFICETVEEMENPIAVVGMVEDVKPMGGSGYVTKKVREIVAQYYGG